MRILLNDCQSVLRHILSEILFVFWCKIFAVDLLVYMVERVSSMLKYHGCVCRTCHCNCKNKIILLGSLLSPSDGKIVRPLRSP